MVKSELTQITSNSVSHQTLFRINLHFTYPFGARSRVMFCISKYLRKKCYTDLFPTQNGQQKPCKDFLQLEYQHKLAMKEKKLDELWRLINKPGSSSSYFELKESAYHSFHLWRFIFKWFSKRHRKYWVVNNGQGTHKGSVFASRRDPLNLSCYMWGVWWLSLFDFCVLEQEVVWFYVCSKLLCNSYIKMSSYLVI